jgi:hypothetical protein
MDRDRRCLTSTCTHAQYQHISQKWYYKYTVGTPSYLLHVSRKGKTSGLLFLTYSESVLFRNSEDLTNSIFRVKMEAASSSKMSVTYHNTTQHHNLEHHFSYPFYSCDKFQHTNFIRKVRLTILPYLSVPLKTNQMLLNLGIQHVIEYHSTFLQYIYRD